MVREYIEITECGSIASLIEELTAVKRGMPTGSTEEQLRFRGDDNFGRHLLVTYMRPETTEEALLSGALSAKPRSDWADPMPLKSVSAR